MTSTKEVLQGWRGTRIVGAFVASMAALLLAVAPAAAHTDEYFDANPSPHGGQVRMSGPYHLELVVGSDELQVYVTDHANNLIDTEGATGGVSIADGSSTRKLSLIPAGGNGFRARLDQPIAADARCTVAVTMPGEPTATAVFTLRGPRPGAGANPVAMPPAEDHSHHGH